MKHVVMWKLIDSVDRDQTIGEMRTRLEALVGMVPGLLSLRVYPAYYPGERNWDVMLESEHESVEALDVYRDHPAHLEAAAWVNEHTAERATVDYLPQ